MTRVALRGLLGRKLRTALTAVAIVLGVALVAGTLILTDSISKAFDNIFTDSRQGSSVVISGKSAFDLTDDSGATAPPLNESLLQTVREQPDVAAAEGSVNGEAQLIGDDNKAIVYGGAPNLGVLDRKRGQPLQSTLTRRGLMAVGRRGGYRRLDCRQGGIRRRGHRRRPGPRACRAAAYLGDREVRVGLHDRRGDARRLRPPDRAAGLRHAGEARRDRRGREGRSLRRAARQALGDILPRNTQVRTADEQAQNDAKDTNRSSASSARSCSPSAASRFSSAPS